MAKENGSPYRVGAGAVLTRVGFWRNPVGSGLAHVGAGAVWSGKGMLASPLGGLEPIGIVYLTRALRNAYPCL